MLLCYCYFVNLRILQNERKRLLDIVGTIKSQVTNAMLVDIAKIKEEKD